MSGIGLAKKGAGKAYQAFKKAASKIQDKADKHSEKMIKEMNSPKILDKVKGYSKLLAGSLSLGTLFPSTIDKEKPETFIIIGDQKYKVQNMAKGGRAMLRGGGICKKGMNKKAVGKNS